MWSSERNPRAPRGPLGIPHGTLVALGAVAGAAAGCVVPVTSRTPVAPAWAGLSELPGSQPPQGPSGIELIADSDRPEPTRQGLVLTLEEAIQVALRANRSLADVQDAAVSAQYFIAAAEAEFELKIFPGLRGGLTRGDDVEDEDEDFGVAVDLVKRLSTGTDITVGPSVDRLGDTRTSALNATIRQPLIRGSSPSANRSAVLSAEFSERTRLRLLHTARIQVVVDTVRAAYEVVRQREFVRLNEDSAERLAGHVEAAKARQRTGLTGAIDVFRATLQLGQARDNLAFAREAHEDALDSLRLVLGIPIATEIDVSAPLEYDLVRLGESEAIAIAHAERVEIERAEDAVHEASRLALVAKHNTLPDLDLTLSYSQVGTGNSLADSTDLDSGVYGFSLVTSSDISRTTERAILAQRRLDVVGARRALVDTQDRIARQVKGQLRNLQRAESRIDIQRGQIGQAQGKLEVARLKFRRGLTSNFDVIEAESELRRAQTNLVSAVIDYVRGAYELRAALGTLIERS